MSLASQLSVALKRKLQETGQISRKLHLQNLKETRCYFSGHFVVV